MGAPYQLQPSESIGPYRLERLLGRGGMAEVFAATHVGAAGFERLVCIKRILPHLAGDGEFRRLFMREARVAGRLSHSNLVQVFDCIEDGPVLAIVMELLDGIDLRGLNRTLLWRGERLAQHLVATVGAYVLLGLAYAHEQGIVHRDISPHNVLVSCEGEVKIVDFGVAKAMFSHVTKTGEFKGKLAYMSPEQALGKPVDLRTDLYSLGLVLYELCTRQRFFTQNHQAELIGAVTHAQRPVLEDVHPVLAGLIEGLLEPDRERRFQTALEALRSVGGWRAFGPRCTVELRELVRSAKQEEEKLVTKPRTGEASSDSWRTEVVPGADIGQRLERPVVPSSPNAPTATREDDVAEALALIPTQEMHKVDESGSGYETSSIVAQGVGPETGRARSTSLLLVMGLVVGFVLFLVVGLGIGIAASSWSTSEIATEPRSESPPSESSPRTSSSDTMPQRPPSEVPTKMTRPAPTTTSPSQSQPDVATHSDPQALPTIVEPESQTEPERSSSEQRERAVNESPTKVKRARPRTSRDRATSSQTPRAPRENDGQPIRESPFSHGQTPSKHSPSREGIRESPF